MKKTITTLSLMAAALLATTILVCPHPARAGSIGPDLIALFPKEVGSFWYADLKAARKEKWFPQLKAQMLPEHFRQFEQFLASAGIDPNTQVEQLAWGLVADAPSAKESTETYVPSGEEIVGLALGSFNPDSAETYFKKQKLPTFKVRGYTLFAFGSGSGANDLYFLFIDSSTAAFGHRKELEKMVEIRFGAEEGLLRSEKMFPLINEMNGSGVVWAVLNPAYTRLAVRQLAPGVEQFPEATKLITRMQNLLLTINASGNIDGKFSAVCGSVEDANTLGQLIQAAFLYQRYQTQKENPDLAQLLDQARVTPAGDRVELRLSLSDDQMTSLIKHNTFALKM